MEQFARKAIGTPFKPHGRSYEAVDCWGLVWLAYRDVYGVALPSYDERYLKVNDFKTLDQVYAVEKDIKWRRVDSGRAGDVALVFMRGLAIHVGLLLDARRMLHVEHGIETCVQPLSAFRLEGIYRYAG